MCESGTGGNMNLLVSFTARAFHRHHDIGLVGHPWVPVRIVHATAAARLSTRSIHLGECSTAGAGFRYHFLKQPGAVREPLCQDLLIFSSSNRTAPPIGLRGRKTLRLPKRVPEPLNFLGNLIRKPLGFASLTRHNCVGLGLQRGDRLRLVPFIFGLDAPAPSGGRPCTDLGG